MKFPTLFAALMSAMAILSCNPGDSTSEKPRIQKDTSAVSKTWADSVNINLSATQPADTYKTYSPATDITYHFIRSKDSIREAFRSWSPAEKRIIYTLNRVDRNNLQNADTLIVPNRFPEDVREISPFPMQVPALEGVARMALFSYPLQAFATYDKGRLAHWGPVSMGRKEQPTPAGLFFVQARDLETVSHFDDEWVLRWTVTLDTTKKGLGWHEGPLIGKPMAHGGLRLREPDAQYLYQFTEPAKDREDSTAEIPVIVFGEYPWKAKGRPWNAVLRAPDAVALSVETLQELIQPFMEQIVLKKEP